MSTKSITERRRFLLFAALAVAGRSGAQSLYRYLDDNGHWVYSDRPPEGEFERLEVDHDRAPGFVRLYQRTGLEGDDVLAVENGFDGPIQIAFRVVAAANLADEVPLRGNRILGPRTDTALIDLVPARVGSPVRARFDYQYIHGDPAAKHRPEQPYRLPYALATRHRVSQAWPDKITHGDPANAYAVDFEMPIGTNVFAARAGIVIETTSDFYEAGVEERFARRANMVRVLHEDGTYALYAHLNWNSIRVGAGQRIARGEYIADSGNTGFSTGPHLHFVVQHNIGGEIDSVPVEFAGAGGPETLATGDEPVAY